MSKGKSAREIMGALDLNLEAFKVNYGSLLEECNSIVTRLEKRGESDLASHLAVAIRGWQKAMIVVERRHAEVRSDLEQTPVPKRPKRTGANDDRPVPGGTA